MKSEIKEISPTKKIIEIEIPAEEFDAFCQEALKELIKELEFPGFRKGMVPESIAKEKINENHILSYAAETAINRGWTDFLKQTDLEIVSQPIINILKMAKGNPFVFSAEAEVLKEIKLPDIKAVAKSIKKEEANVEAKDVDEAIHWLRQSRAKLEDKEGAAEKGDFAEITLDNKNKDGFILGKGHHVKNLEENLLGMEKNQEKEFDSEGGKIKVRLDSLKKVQLPEINDEWAKTLGDFQNLEALRKSAEEGIRQEKDIALRQKKRMELLEKIGAKTKVEIPETLIKKEIEGMMDNLKARIKRELGIGFEDYLAQVKKTQDQVSKEFEKMAEERIRNFLIIRQIIKDEKIEATEEEISERIKEILKDYPDSEQAKKEIDLNKVKPYIEDEVKTEKAFNLFGFN
ncbi:MAG: trigger factor [Candidatus Pacebacteria bacterium]|nr:trigger factor [Candidatus Paceibacterota bacterium]